MAKRGIIIANTGSPASPDAQSVREYLRDFLTDPHICPLPAPIWNVILNAFVLPRRSVKSARKYEQIWTEEGSPLSATMARLANGLQLELGNGFIVRHAMSYGAPSLPDTLREFARLGCDDITVVPLYPQAAHSTTMVVSDKAESALVDMGWRGGYRLVNGYSDVPEYAPAVAQSVLDAGFDASRDVLLMAFHSVPMRDIERGDTYAETVGRSARAIADALGLDDDSWQVGFQCRFDKSRKWLGPFVREAVERLDGARNQDGRLFVVTPNFSIDCLETLYDVEVALRQGYLALHPEMTDDDFVYVPCLNDSPAHIRLIASLL